MASFSLVIIFLQIEFLLHWLLSEAVSDSCLTRCLKNLLLILNKPHFPSLIFFCKQQLESRVFRHFQKMLPSSLVSCFTSRPPDRSGFNQTEAAAINGGKWTPKKMCNLPGQMICSLRCSGLFHYYMHLIDRNDKNKEQLLCEMMFPLFLQANTKKCFGPFSDADKKKI